MIVPSMSSLADRIERAAPDILRRAHAELDDTASRELADAAIARLLDALRAPEVPALAIPTALGTEAATRALRAVRTEVLDAIEADASTVELRRVAEWFATVCEHALCDRNRRLVAMLDAIDDRMILLDRSARVVFLNRASDAAARGMHGVSREQMIGRSTLEGTHSPSYERYVAGMVARASSGETVGGEFLLPLPGGAIWHEHQFHPVIGDAGDVEAIAVSSRDIHARKLAEGRLHLLSKIGLLAETNELDSVLARAAGLAIPELADWSALELVRDGVIERSTVVHPDPERRALAEHLLGEARRTTPRRVDTIEASARIVDLRDADEPLRAIDPALFAVLDRFAAATAITVPFVVMNAPIALATFVLGPESGRRHSTTDLAIADELARRAAQIVENARLHAELAQALAYRERVMGILGHDLRNPVAAVISLSQTLAQRSDVPERTKEGLRHIQAAAARMNQMIATILDFTRLRFHGALVLVLESFDLTTLTRAVVDELRAAHPGRTITIEARGEHRGRWDVSRLGQVISNLVGNALTHGARESPVAVNLTMDGPHAVLEVRNAGPKIPEEMIGKLFEPFWQGASASSTKARGLGLGLLIVQQIVKAHHGAVTVQSDHEHTTFTVRLPRSM